MSQTDLHPCSVEVIGHPGRGVLDVVLDLERKHITRVNITTDLAWILYRKLQNKLEPRWTSTNQTAVS